MWVLEAGAGAMAFIAASGAYFLLVHGIAKLFFPKSSKAESVAFWFALITIAIAWGVLGGGPVDSDDRWRRK